MNIKLQIVEFVCAWALKSLHIASINPIVINMCLSRYVAESPCPEYSDKAENELNSSL